MSKLIFALGVLISSIAFAGNEGGGGPGLVPNDDESTEAVLWKGFEGDIANIQTGKFENALWTTKDHLISLKDLQQLDVKIGNALNESARTQSWVGLTK